LNRDRPYRVELAAAAQREFRRLPLADRTRLIAPLLSLETEPLPPSAIKIGGTELWRIRVGDLRIICRVNLESHLVIVLRAARRNEATYRRLRDPGR
jgi:mRNA interferase RelE/StbE